MKETRFMLMDERFMLGSLVMDDCILVMDRQSNACAKNRINSTTACKTSTCDIGSHWTAFELSNQPSRFEDKQALLGDTRGKRLGAFADVFSLPDAVGLRLGSKGIESHAQG
jgi:hypothetical protein